MAKAATSDLGGIVIPNYIPYLVLVLLSILLFYITWRKADKDKYKLLPFYLCLAGLVFLFEYIIMVLFKCYAYIPNVFKEDYFDNVLGANVSDGFTVPTTSAFIAVTQMRFGWLLLIDAVYFGIEELFLHWGIYHHFWWKTGYTAVSLPVHFLLARWLWGKILTHEHRFPLQLGMLYFVNIAVQGTFLFYLAAITRLFLFRVPWFDDPVRGHIAFITLYLFVDSIFYSWVVCKRARWYWKALLLLVQGCVNVYLHERGVLELSSWWVFGLLMVVETGVLFALIGMRRLLVKRAYVENKSRAHRTRPDV